MNTTAVRVEWSFNYSVLRPPALRTDLSFAVEITAQGRYTKVETVPGHLTHLLFTEVVKLFEYQFRVTARSGDTASQPSQPSDVMLGGVPSCTLPTNLRVVAVQAFSVSLAWDQSTCEEYVTGPLYFIKYSDTPGGVQVGSPAVTVADRRHLSISISPSLPLPPPSLPSLPPLVSLQYTQFTGSLSITIPNVFPAQGYYFCVGVQYLLPSVCSELVHATTPSVGETQPASTH